jgi:hypothetical protein
MGGTNPTMRTFVYGTIAQYGLYPASISTITCNGTVTLNNVDFADINVLGTSAPWSGNNLGDAGDAGNIIFNAGKTVYWTGTGNANWGSNSWNTVQAATPNANIFPLAQDSVVFDATYPAAGNVITIDSTYDVTNIDTSARTANAITFAFGSNKLTVLGNATFSSNTLTTSTANGQLVFNPRDSVGTFTTGNTTITPQVIMIANSTTGGLTITDGLTTTNTLNLQGGTFNMANLTVNASNVLSSTGVVKSISYGTSGVLNLTGSNTTIWNVPVTNFTYTGTSNVNLTYSGSTGTRTINASTPAEANTTSFNITAGTDNVQVQNGTYVRSLNFTGFTGNWSATSPTIYGNVTLGAGMTIKNSAQPVFAGTNTYIGTSRSFTTNGVSANTLGLALNYTGSANITLSLQDDFIQSSSATSGITIYGGTLALNGANANVYSLVFSGSNVKGISLGSGNMNVFGSGTSFNANSAFGNTTITPGPGYILMSNTSSAKTFDGGGRTYYNLYQAGAGNLTIVGNNTLNTLGATVANTAIIFTAGTTTTVSDFTVSGNLGNLITLKSSTTGTKFILSKSGGIVDVNYLSISDSNATGGAFWYAGYTSANVANNQGWLFTGSQVLGFSMSGGIFIDTTTGGITISS